MDVWAVDHIDSAVVYGGVTDSSTDSANIIDIGRTGYVEYEIDIERVLRDDLPSVLDRVDGSPLNEATVASIPAGAKGAYVLYENGHPVYAGKTDTRHGFRQRLTRHANTIQHRHNLDPATITFKAIRILVFSNFDVEAILMTALRGLDPTALRWNATGFGSNDPGHNRERQQPAVFDSERPIDIDRPLPEITPGKYSPVELLAKLKSTVPYLIRYQSDGSSRRAAPHPDILAGSDIDIDASGISTTRAVLCKVLDALPNGWVSTVFPDRVILYKETHQYQYALSTLQKQARPL